MIFHAPCGFGKSSLADELISYGCARVIKISADCINDEIYNADKWDMLYIDNLHTLHSEDEQSKLCALIRDNPKKRFVLLTRGTIPGWLMPFRLSGLMYEITANEMFFDSETLKSFFEKSFIQLTDAETDVIMQSTSGYPLAVALTAEHLKSGESFDGKLRGELLHEIYLYFDEMVYRRFDLPTRRFLLELAPLEKFTVELAKIVSGDMNAGKMITQLQNDSGMMLYDSPDTFHFWPVFRDFLM